MHSQQKGDALAVLFPDEVLKKPVWKVSYVCLRPGRSCPFNKKS